MGPWVNTVAKTGLSPLGIGTAQATMPGINSSLSVPTCECRILSILSSNICLYTYIYICELEYKLTNYYKKDFTNIILSVYAYAFNLSKKINLYYFIFI